jgi:hypothetical protein
MTTIQIPTAQEVRERLSGVDRLLTARKWERAAIVCAFTGIGGPRNSPQPPPPKLNIRQFAAQGYAGLTTNKSVERYRAAWVTAIDNGWAVPVEPGQTVELPDQPFPAWPGSNEDAQPQPRQWRPLEQRVFGHLDQAATALRRLADAVSAEPLPDEVRGQLRERLTELQHETETALRALQQQEERREESVPA